MRQRSLDEMITYFNQEIDKMDIDRRYKIALLGMVTAIGCTAKSTIERKKGRWGNAGEYPWDKCSVCGHCVNPYEDDYFFCPHCGADMRGENDGK